MLKWMRAQVPCPWSVSVCNSTAEGGYLDVLRWARKNDPPCPWDAITCASAASMGHLETQKLNRRCTPTRIASEQRRLYKYDKAIKSIRSVCDLMNCNRSGNFASWQV